MRVIGFSFSEERAAWLAREELTERYELNPPDARIGPLAEDGVLLAVRAREENLDGVIRLLEQHGGQEVADVDERWTELSALRQVEKAN